MEARLGQEEVPESHRCRIAADGRDMGERPSHGFRGDGEPSAGCSPALFHRADHLAHPRKQGLFVASEGGPGVRLPAAHRARPGAGEGGDASAAPLLRGFIGTADVNRGGAKKNGGGGVETWAKRVWGGKIINRFL